MGADFLEFMASFALAAAIAAALVYPARRLSWLKDAFSAAAFVYFVVVSVLLFTEGFWWLFSMLPYAVAAGCLWYRVSELEVCVQREIPLDVVKGHFVVPMGCCLFTICWHGLGLLFGWGDAGIVNSIGMIAVSVASLFIENIRVPIALFDTFMAFNKYKLKSDTQKLIDGMGENNAKIGQELLKVEIRYNRVREIKFCDAYYYIKSKCYTDAIKFIQDDCQSVPRESIEQMCKRLCDYGLGANEFNVRFLCQSIPDIVKCFFADGVYLVHSSNLARICICPVCGTVTLANSPVGDRNEVFCSATCRKTGSAFGIKDGGVASLEVTDETEFANYVVEEILHAESSDKSSVGDVSAKGIAMDLAKNVATRQGIQTLSGVAEEFLGGEFSQVVKHGLRIRASIRDVAKFLDGKITKTQLAKNIVTNGGGIAGSATGIKLGGVVGTALGGPIGCFVGVAIGGWIGGKIGKTVAGGVADGLGEDDNVVVGRELLGVFHFLSIRYCLDQEGLDKFFDAVRRVANSDAYTESVISSGKEMRPCIAMTLVPMVMQIVRR